MLTVARNLLEVAKIDRSMQGARDSIVAYFLEAFLVHDMQETSEAKV